MTTWDEIFAPIDKVVATMPPVERACNSCAYADVPPMPEAPGKGWMARCTAPLPANIMLNPSRVEMMMAAADVERWQGKRLKPCPAWKEKTA